MRIESSAKATSVPIEVKYSNNIVVNQCLTIQCFALQDFQCF